MSANPRGRFGVLFITFAFDILFFLLIQQKGSMMTRRYLKMLSAQFELWTLHPRGINSKGNNSASLSF